MPNEGATEVGSIVGYLRMDITDWLTAADRAEERARQLGLNSPNIKVKVEGMNEVILALQAIKAQEDRVSQSGQKMTDSLKSADSSGLRPLLSTALLLGPALAPLANVGAAGVGGLALGLGTLFLAFKGVSAEMTAGTALGERYSAGLATLTGDLATLEHQAAAATLATFNKEVAYADSLMPQVSAVVRQFAAVSADAAAHLANGLVAGFLTLRPLLTDVITDVDKGAAAFDTWTQKSGGISKFATLAAAELPTVEKDLTAIFLAVGHVGAALGTTGVFALNSLGIIARGINAIPVSQLDHVAVAVAIMFTAWKGYQVINLAQRAIVSVSGSIQQLTLWQQRNTLATDAQTARTAANEAALLANASASDELAVATATATAAREADAVATAAEAAAARAASVSLFAALGPLGLLAAGIGAVAYAWLGSSGPAKSATNDVQAYTDALIQSNLAVDANVRSSVAKSLSDSGALTDAKKLGISVSDVTDAVTGQGNSLETLQAKLAPIAAAYDKLTAAKAAANSNQRGRAAPTNDTGYTDAQLKAAHDLEAALGGEASAFNTSATAAANQIDASKDTIQTTLDLAGALNTAANSQGLQTQTAQDYVRMAGFVESAYATNASAATHYTTVLAEMKRAEDTANTATQGLLSALDTYSQSSGTAADKAQLLGAVLKASQGDALAYGAGIAGATDATNNLIKGFDASQKASINAKTGLIDYTKAGAAPLIGELQSMQDAAVAAAQATYQHEVATKGDSAALTDAQTIFQNMTNGALTANYKQLGITKDEAKNLGDAYFNISDKDLTSTVQAIGLSDINTTLQQIGQLLAHLTGQTWVIPVTADIAAAQIKAVGTGNATSGHHATGGLITGLGTGTSDSNPAWVSNREYIMPAAIVNQPGVLPLLEALRGSGSGVMAPAIGSPAVRSVAAGYTTAPSPGSSSAGSSGDGALASGKRLVLVVGGQEFDAYVDYRSAGVVSSANSQSKFLAGASARADT